MNEILLHHDGIPILNITDSATANPTVNTKFANDVHIAATKWGCMHVKLPQHILQISQSLLQLNSLFHNHSSQVKSLSHKDDAFLGYSEKRADHGRETANRFSVYNCVYSKSRPDSVYARLFLGENIWPQQIPQFENRVISAANVIAPLGELILSGAFQKFGKELQEDRAKGFEEYSLFMKFIKYNSAKTRAIGFSPHRDYGGLTIIFHKNPDGLWVEPVNGPALRVAACPSTAFVLFGEMSRYWSGGIIHAPRHFVSIEPNQDRTAVVCCYEPSFDYEVGTLGTCQSEGGNRPGLSYGARLVHSTLLIPVARERGPR
jgi:isopenicillin N synthase-like dioxygenase